MDRQPILSKDVHLHLSVEEWSLSAVTLDVGRPDSRSLDGRDRDPRDSWEADRLIHRTCFARDLYLPRGLERDRVHGIRTSCTRPKCARVNARGVSSRTLSALHDDRGCAADISHGDLDRLQSAGLIRVVSSPDHPGSARRC